MFLESAFSHIFPYVPIFSHIFLYFPIFYHRNHHVFPENSIEITHVFPEKCHRNLHRIEIQETARGGEAVPWALIRAPGDGGGFSHGRISP